VEQGSLVPVENDDQADFMGEAMEILGAAGLLRYEVSNYARPGCESRHNLNYWRGGDYLAAGCGAHGHHAGHRWWNERGARRYVQKMQSGGTVRAGDENLSVQERLSELVLLGLRLREGLALEAAARRLNFDVRGALHRSPAWPVLTEQGILREEKSFLLLNPASWPVADAVAARLLP
jgi:oxygen-independent coproporphyrinogen-3 oxidase